MMLIAWWPSKIAFDHVARAYAANAPLAMSAADLFAWIRGFTVHTDQGQIESADAALLEIRASDQVVRTVTENSRTPKFDTQGFERGVKCFDCLQRHKQSMQWPTGRSKPAGGPADHGEQHSCAALIG